MASDPFDTSAYSNDLAIPSRDNSNITPEFWTEWYSNPSDNTAAYMPTTVSVPSPVESNLSAGFHQSPSTTNYSTIPQDAFIDPGFFSVAATDTTGATSVDGEEKDSIDCYGISGDKKRRKSSAYTTTGTQGGDRNAQQDTRRKSMPEPARRERNRTAAAKCRAKSRVAEEELKETQRIERDRNAALRATVAELNNESIMLKHELLCHSGCDHPIINKYLSRAADQISRRAVASGSNPQVESFSHNS